MLVYLVIVESGLHLWLRSLAKLLHLTSGSSEGKCGTKDFEKVTQECAMGFLDRTLIKPNSLEVVQGGTAPKPSKNSRVFGRMCLIHSDRLSVVVSSRPGSPWWHTSLPGQSRCPGLLETFTQGEWFHVLGNIRQHRCFSYYFPS